MSREERTGGPQSRSSPSGSTTSAPSGRNASTNRAEEWSGVEDPSERRKIQNKLAQRRFREKIREQKEESEREAENQRRAGNAYATPEPGDIDTGSNELSGLPWGGVSMRHIVETGKTKDQSSRQSSRENSVYASASRTGGSSR
ncbi:uncharacterized protein EI97DRAFT_454175 [Westerdykella ornata]|uniref:BZIP domain-containing protein n=1 Tax=Westerdykella ornata TaxID=318751 RepID=A0A6A6JYM4_WESOR|nr:uncharacterized protein EI97DRAFT_454175 [Westerdykella ornata]KAF2280948.1 hypothetical protein EI97DRAFT_454175 [Westerdykella ornata]